MSEEGENISLYVMEVFFKSLSSVETVFLLSSLDKYFALISALLSDS